MFVFVTRQIVNNNKMIKTWGKETIIRSRTFWACLHNAIGITDHKIAREMMPEWKRGWKNEQLTMPTMRVSRGVTWDPDVTVRVCPSGFIFSFHIITSTGFVLWSVYLAGCLFLFVFLVLLTSLFVYWSDCLPFIHSSVSASSPSISIYGVTFISGFIWERCRSV